MKMRVIVSILAIFLMAPLAFADAPSVTSGDCRFVRSGEIVQLTDYDPVTHSGLIAEGFSKEGDRISLENNFHGLIYLTLQVANTGQRKWTQANLVLGGPTELILRSEVFRGGNSERDWIDCDITVE